MAEFAGVGGNVIAILKIDGGQQHLDRLIRAGLVQGIDGSARQGERRAVQVAR